MRELAVGDQGYGLWATFGGELTGQGIDLRQTVSAAVWVDRGARAGLEGLFVTETMPLQTGLYGAPVWVSGGATASVTRADFEGFGQVGALAEGDGTELAVTDTLVRDGRGDGLGAGGLALAVRGGATLRVQRADARDLRSAGIGALHAIVDARDLRIAAVEYVGDLEVGYGANLRDGSQARLSRTCLLDTVTAGVLVAMGTELDVEDVLVREVRGIPNAAPGSGFGLDLRPDSRVTGERLVIERAEQIGITSSSGALVLLDDVVVRDTQPHGDTSRFGHALHVFPGARAQLRRARFDGSHELGIAAIGEGAVVDLQDTAVLDTRQRPCDENLCPEARFGTAVGVYNGASFEADRFAFDGSALCGVQLAGAATEVDLENGEVTRHDIGACVQVEGYDFARLTRGVRYRDNGRNVETTELGLPDPISVQ
jgi:hypothetical protein